jgi:ABC-2 type transport system ATP-binding protein
VPFLTTNRGRLVGVLLVVVAVLVGVLVTLTSRTRPDLAGVRAEPFRLTVPAGPGEQGTVSLDATLYLPTRTPAPAVLVAHGFGGSKTSVDVDARDLAARGFVALTWSARGFGRSTGQISLDSPGHEVADASRLIDYLAGRPEVLLDRPGDPRVGVTGGSYGGALALLLAGYDHRVDAIAPAITWNDLGQALFPNDAETTAPAGTPARTAFGSDGVFKRGWAGILFSAGRSPDRVKASDDQDADQTEGQDSNSTNSSSSSSSSDSDSDSATDSSTDDTTPAPQADPAGPLPGVPPPTSCGRFAAPICQADTQVAATGRLDPTTSALLRQSSPVSVTDRIKAPTLLIQGESDTLFGLDHADATARQIAEAGGTVSVLWYSGGHDGGAPGPEVREQIAAWFDRYLGQPPGGSRPDPSVLPAQGALRYAVQGGVQARRGTQTVRTVSVDRYPGLPGAAPVQRRELALHGGTQDVLNPAGGNPAAVTAIPGVGSAAGSLVGRLAALSSTLPGQSATFATQPLPEQLLVAGSPDVRITVAAVPGQPSSGEAVLFGKLLDVAPNGRVVLLGGAVAPMRITVPTGSAAQVTITLPPVVAPVAAGHRLAVSIGTTDQAYQGPTAPSVWRIELAGDGRAPTTLDVPLVPGQPVTANTVPLGPAIGIGLILLVALVTAVADRLRRRHGGTADQAEPDRAPPLVVRDVRKAYPGGITAVNGVSFTMRRNQVLGLLGPNGAGKTTVLRMLMGLIHPTGGRISVFGQQVTPGAPVLSRIGSFVEGPGLLPHLSGAENLRLYWAATGRPTADAHLAEALEIAGLGSTLDRAVRTYSQGMRQRLAIAQAMLGLPDLLVLDEPTNGLDPPQIHAMREVLRNYANDGRAVLVSSHLLAEVEQTCDHLVVMHRGTVVADGTMAELVSGAGQSSFRVDDPARAAEVLRALSGVSEIETADGMVHADLNGTPRSDAVGRLVGAGLAVESVGPRRRLEDAFLRLIGEDARR